LQAWGIKLSTEKATFTDFGEAMRFCDEREAAGDEHVTMLANTPRPGWFEVSYGTLEVDNSFQGLMDRYNQIFDAREKESWDNFNRACEDHGRQSAAEDAAKAAGYEGRDAEVFIDGFTGYSIKAVNPRREGREDIFRAGRKAAQSAEGQRAIRVAQVKARSILTREPPRPWSEGGEIANGVGCE
jgi:hypothetical protein